MIEPDNIPPYTSQHNNVPERYMGTLECRASALQIDSELPPTFWPFAVDMATKSRQANIDKRTLNKSIDFKIPLKNLATERKLHLDKLKRSGCITFVLDHY